MCYTKKKAAKEVVSMKTIITGKNYTPSDKLKETIEKKFEKLDKYFSNEITGNIMVIKGRLQGGGHHQCERNDFQSRDAGGRSV